MGKKLIIGCIIMLSVVFSAITPFASESNVKNSIIAVDKVCANANESVDVPIYLSRNTGICGATLTVSYDNALKLTNVTRGDAFSKFFMTTNKDLSANPCKILFDAQDEVTENGILAVLSFDTPQAAGIYDIKISYEDGDIVDGKPSPITVKTVDGYIAIGSDNKTIALGDKTALIPPTDEADATVYAVFYADDGKITSVKSCPLSTENIAFSKDSSSSFARIFCWTDNLMPLCKDQTFALE